MIWFTADPHYGHANIIKYCKRPFSGVPEMNEKLVAAYSVIKPKDELWILGDFAWTVTDALWALKKMPKCKLYLIQGNHDHQALTDLNVKSYFDAIFPPYLERKFGGHDFTLCHYAMRTWNRSHKGSIQLYGHTHGAMPALPRLRQMDVGVDACDYRPISLDRVLEKMLAIDVPKLKRDKNDAWIS